MGGLSGSAQNESFTRVRIRYHKSAPKKNGKQINKICKNSGLLLVKESVFFLPKMAGSLDTKKNQQSQSIAGFLALAGDEGFEPPQTESESGVLPLHKSPKWPLAEAHDYYNDFSQKVKTNFFFFAEIKTGRYGPLMVKE
mgnify:CR=1 FL=1